MHELVDGDGLEHEDIRSHEHRIMEQSNSDTVRSELRFRLNLLLFELRHPVQPSHRGRAAQDPGQLCDLGDLRLVEEDTAFRIHTTGEEHGREIEA